MNFMAFINQFSVSVASFARANPVIVIAVLILLAIFIYRQPLLSFFILLFCLLLLVVTYLIMGVRPVPF